MSKNREAKRRKKLQNRRSGRQTAPARQPARQRARLMPSAHTLWRTVHLDAIVQDGFMSTVMNLQPSLWQRDADNIKAIEQAADVEAVLDLTPTTMNLADHAWLKRMREFGPLVANAIAGRINSGWLERHADRRQALCERYLGALRWCDNSDADALMRCWDALNDKERSFGCVLAGLLGAKAAADPIWELYRATRSSPDNLFVGALWGLIDLQDARAADALFELMTEQRAFYELFGFISRAGDARLMVPLVTEVHKQAGDSSADAMWAMTGIAHRLGRDELLRFLGDGADESSVAQLQVFVDQLFLYDQDAVERHFETFYARSLRQPLDLVGAMPSPRH